MNNVNLAGQTAPKLGHAAFATQLADAAAAGDPRYQYKKQQIDRPGISRGRAQRNMAGIGGAQDVSQGIADAYSTHLQRATTDANNALAQQFANEQFAQTLGALQQQNAYAQQMAALQRQNSLLSGLLR